MSRRAGIADRLRAHPIVVALGSAVAVMAGLAVLKGFVTDTAPWLIDVLAPISPLLTSTPALLGVVTGFAVYNVVASMRYRLAIEDIVRDYYAEVSELEHRIDPARHPAVSARIGSGDADPAWVAKVLNRYGIQPERKMRAPDNAEVSGER